MGCSHNCQSCGGCRSSLELTQPELDLLNALGQFSFLPVARKADDMTPRYLESPEYDPEICSLALQHLEAKGLISIDYDAPLSGADMRAYKDFPVHGSIALTARGQQILEALELHGLSTDP